MNNELMQQMKDILTDGTGINLFFAMKKDNEEVEIRKADLEDGDTQEDLLRQFVSLLQEDFLYNEDLKILEMSEAEERKNVVYHYDLDKFPKSLKYFFDFDYKKKYDKFSYRQDDLYRIDAYIIVVGNQENHCVLYKRFYPVFLLGRGRFCLIPSDNRFKEFDKEVLSINRDYQFIKVKENIYIKDLNVLEKYGGFKAIIEKEANNAVEAIEQLDILEESEVLRDTLTMDIAFARKLCKIGKSSPVLELNIPNQAIINFSKKHPGVAGKLRYNQNEDKIILTTKKSQNVFLKILDDSYLVSQLTQIYYDSLTKEKVKEERM